MISFTVLVEKLVRSTSVGKIYLLVKANDKEASFDRLSKEVCFSINVTYLQLIFSSFKN